MDFVNFSKQLYKQQQKNKTLGLLYLFWPGIDGNYM